MNRLALPARRLPVLAGEDGVDMVYVATVLPDHLQLAAPLGVTDVRLHPSGSLVAREVAGVDLAEIECPEREVSAEVSGVGTEIFAPTLFGDHASAAAGAIQEIDPVERGVADVTSI